MGRLLQLLRSERVGGRGGPGFYADPCKVVSAAPAQGPNPVEARAAFGKPLPRFRESLVHLQQARPKVLPGSRHELEYVIFKIETQILHLEAICSLLDGYIAYHKLVRANLKGDKQEMHKQWEACRSSFLNAREECTRRPG